MHSKTAHRHGKNRGSKKFHGQAQPQGKPAAAPASQAVRAAAKPAIIAFPARPAPQRSAANDAQVARSIRDTANIPPVGYRLVDDDFYEITKQDMVFVGGRHPYWMPARRAGEIGSLRRFSTVAAVARLAA